MVYLVTYDLKEPNTLLDYTNVIEGIKKCGTWARIEQSVWLIESDLAAKDIRDDLKQHVRPNDVLFVARLEGSWASRNIGDKRTEWLKARTFN